MPFPKIPAIFSILLTFQFLTAQTMPAEGGPVQCVTVAKGLENPWAIAFLPEGRILVNERPGRMRIVEVGGRLSAPLKGLPEVYAVGQGGLLDLVLDPDFSKNQKIYFTFSEPGKGGAGTALASARLVNDELKGAKVLFRQNPKVDGGLHFGSRLAFAPDGTIFMGMGDRYHREEAQNLKSHLGKIVRIKSDGSVPSDNPLVNRKEALPEIFSLGHRNIQGLTRHPETGEIWAHEHGARGGDEINVIGPGKNYGWPVITLGIDYNGQKIGEGTTKPGMEQPLYFWVPSIAPSGMTFYSGKKIPAWRGNLFVGALAGAVLVRLELKAGRVTHEERLFKNLYERIRDVREGPDGFLYFTTDHPSGRIIRIEPASP